ncbi:MAG: tRNA (adenosine(37)-N6)-dimethylallyltransferase MiaA [Tepidisphaeraceae bacterium]
MADVPRLIVLLGPTASGKSALALVLAERLGAEILSVDSMQVYRHMDIGTAKPSAEEQAAVKHHLIDVVEPSDPYTVAQFVSAADDIIANATKPIIATGGTPMYYKALFEGLFDGPAADPAVRAKLAEQPAEALHRRLTEVDPAAAARIHVNDTRRLLRRLEVFEITGKPITEHQQQWDTPHRHAAVWFGLNWEKEQLNRRINARVKQMMTAGWVEETRQLVDRFGTLSKTAGEATGYAELIDHLSGRQSLDDATEQIKIATRQLARRQTKWFRRWQQVNWLAGDASVGANAEKVLQHL